MNWILLVIKLAIFLNIILGIGTRIYVIQNFVLKLFYEFKFYKSEEVHENYQNTKLWIKTVIRIIIVILAVFLASLINTNQIFSWVNIFTCSFAPYYAIFLPVYLTYLWNKKMQKKVSPIFLIFFCFIGMTLIISSWIVSVIHLFFK